MAKPQKHLETVDMAEFDRESSYRNNKGLMGKIITAILLIFCTFQLATTVFGTLPAQLQRMIHLGFVVVLAYLLYPARRKNRKDVLTPVDAVCAVAFLGCVSYYVFNYRELVGRSGAYNQTDAIVAVIAVLLVMEACRRVVGMPIVIIRCV